MADVALDYRPDARTAPELFKDVVVAPQTVSPQNMFLIQDMMRDVVRRGTGRRAMVLGRNDLSGKTGTSNDRRDAWFGGFNADLASIVWVGYDDDLPLGPGRRRVADGAADLDRIFAHRAGRRARTTRCRCRKASSRY